ncbi:MAG: hypothetical protein GJV46_14365 [Geobacter sp.]|nr:hypothetical protein [Geobacter sp.]
MKCPKCGYNSFEFHDSCKKCSSDLSGHKMTYGITPIVLPIEVREVMASEFLAASAATGQLSETVETHEDMFAFDLPEEAITTSSTVPTYNEDPFNFDDEPSIATQVSAQSEEDPFADLLETTPQSDSSPFGASPDSTQSAAKPAASDPTGEFDLENFSWDDTPEAATTIGKDAEDDFDSLFGDATESTHK